MWDLINEFNISTKIVDDLYSSIITAGTFLASSIKVAEAAKIIEKKSRDIINSVINDDNQEDIYSSISEKLSYTKNPNIFELKTHVADKIIAENKYCF